MDHRCADTDLQIDIDILMLEYTLFQAINAQLRNLATISGNAMLDPELEHECSRLTRIFDSFIRVFNEHHPAYEHTSTTNFQLDVLEFLVLLSALTSTSSTLFGTGTGTLKKLRLRTERDIIARRYWQEARRRHSRSLSKRSDTTWKKAYIARDVEQQVYASWSFHSESASPDESHIINSYLLISLLPRFMTISAKFIDMIQQTPSLRWVQVAGELMLQAGLESLRLKPSLSSSNASQSLDDCFAWGYVDPDFMPDTSAVEGCDEEIPKLINDMFGQTGISTAASENADWTKVRFGAIQEFLIAPDDSPSIRSCRLERLTAKYPWYSFVPKLVSVVGNIWELSCRDEYLGKPVLAEIEEGHLRSYSLVGPEFAAFATKVGLNVWKT